MLKSITQVFQRDPIKDKGYIIDRNKMLGCGTYGKVFLCKTRDGNTYALKEIKWTGEKKDYDDIMREKNNWLLLDDPHIVKLIDFFEGSHFPDGSAFFYQIMEKCETDLSHWLLNNSNRPIDTCDKMIKQIIEGLKFIHKLKIIHRDLKPENILITVDGKCKIADFGDIVIHIKTLTNAHTQARGSVLYAAPEQLESSKYNLKVDIYSLGIIIMEFYTLYDDNQERINEIENLRRGIIPFKFYNNYNKESVHYINLKYLILKMTDSDRNERPTIEELISRIYTIDDPQPMMLFYPKYDKKSENEIYEIDYKIIDIISDYIKHRKVSIYSFHSQTSNHMIPEFIYKHNNIDETINESYCNVVSVTMRCGIIIWSEPIIIKTDGTEFAIILIESRGLFNKEIPFVEQMMVIELCMSISPFIIVNTEKQFKNDYFQLLYMGLNAYPDTEYQKDLKLSFLVSNYENSDLKYDYGYYDDNYNNGNNLKHLLFNTESDNQSVKFITNMISSYYNVSFYHIPLPSDAELKGNGGVNDFVKHICNYKSIIFNTVSIPIMKKFNTPMSGIKLKEFIKELLKDRDFSVEVSEFTDPEYISMIYPYEIGYKAAINYYGKNMHETRKKLDQKIEKSQFEEYHRKFYNESITLFKSFPLNLDKDYEEKNIIQITESINESREMFKNLFCNEPLSDYVNSKLTNR